MLRGLYSAATGMLVEARRLDVVANNLANVDTVGFKRDGAVIRAFPEFTVSRVEKGSNLPIGRIGIGAYFDHTITELTPGRLKATGNPFDLALEGDGFFAVQAGDAVRYTRKGNFQLGNGGELLTLEGHQVLGENGPVRINGRQFRVMEDGVVEVDGQVVDKLLLVSAEPGALRKLGGDLYEAVGPMADERPEVTVLQGTLEMSNVNVVREMVDMIQVTRAYEANQKVIIAQDETLGKAVNELGRA